LPFRRVAVLSRREIELTVKKSSLIIGSCRDDKENPMWRFLRSRDPGTAMGWLLAAVVLLPTVGSPALAADPIRIGNVAALSGASAQSGEAITRGLRIAIDEINGNGGLLGGRMLELVQRDDESIPPKGLTAARELIFKEQVAAIFGGIDTPVSLALAPLMNREKKIFIGV
jgi:branched-chain amino acid transport system substrate-binding protein